MAHSSAAAATEPACDIRMLQVEAVRAHTPSPPEEQHGWQPVTLPDNWARRWPGYAGPVWYRINWAADCPPSEMRAALMIDAINMAGEVYSNQDLIWRDLRLEEPLSRSWNTSHYWILPQSSLNLHGGNSIWVRVVGVPELSPGLGVVQLGSPEAMLQAHQHRDWKQRGLFFMNFCVTAALGVMALVVWAPRRNNPLLGWYALVAICWVLFGINTLLTVTWPFPDNLAMARFNHLAYTGYITSFSVFCWLLIDRKLSRPAMRLLGSLTLLVAALIVWSPGWWLMKVIADVYTVIFLGNAVLVFGCALRTHKLQHQLLAACLAMMVSVGVRDLLVVAEVVHSRDFYSSYTALLFLLLSALLMRQRILQDARRIAYFNQELKDTVAQACEDLSTTLAQEHALALSNAHLKERLQLAQDLHDGLGGQIVRSIMLVEQNDAPPSKERYLSMLKLLRDDLRQVVDSDGSIGAHAPTTPEEWMIPLRYRFVSLFDDLDIRSEWLAPADWRPPPSALQCMLLARVAEEALTNIIKHSHARTVQVCLSYPAPGILLLHVEDDGMGFDAPATLRAGLGIGMSSMRSRMERMGGQLQVHSRSGHTAIDATLPLAPREMPPQRPPSDNHSACATPIQAGTYGPS